MEGIRASYESHTTPFQHELAQPQPHEPGREAGAAGTMGMPPPTYSQLVTYPLPQTLSPYAASEAMVESGYNRHHERLDRVLVKGFFAGMLISLGVLAQAAVGGNSPAFLGYASGLIRFFESMFYPVGYAFIYALGMELLTWNAVTYALAGMRFSIPFWSWPLNFFLLFWANLVGALTFAGIFSKFGSISNTTDMTDWFINRANQQGRSPWHNILLRSIVSEWLVGWALFFAAMSSSFLSKLAGLWIALATLAVLQLNTLVSDFFFIPMSIILGANMNTAYYIGHILMPEIIGSVIGALSLAGVLYYAYLSHDEPAVVSPIYDYHENNGGQHGQHDVERGGATTATTTAHQHHHGGGNGRTKFPRLSLRKSDHPAQATPSGPQQAMQTPTESQGPITTAA